MKTTLVAAVVVGIWLAPIAYADDHDQAFLSFLAANKVAVDPTINGNELLDRRRGTERLPP